MSGFLIDLRGYTIPKRQGCCGVFAKGFELSNTCFVFSVIFVWSSSYGTPTLA